MNQDAKTAIRLLCILLVRGMRIDRRRALAGREPLLYGRKEAWFPCNRCGEPFDGIASRNTICPACFWEPFQTLYSDARRLSRRDA